MKADYNLSKVLFDIKCKPSYEFLNQTNICVLITCGNGVVDSGE